jgi:hypothetical protein
VFLCPLYADCRLWPVVLVPAHQLVSAAAAEECRACTQAPGKAPFVCEFSSSVSLYCLCWCMILNEAAS